MIAFKLMIKLHFAFTYKVSICFYPVKQYSSVVTQDSIPPKSGLLTQYSNSRFQTMVFLF